MTRAQIFDQALENVKKRRIEAVQESWLPGKGKTWTGSGTSSS